MNVSEADRLLDPGPMSLEMGIERLESGQLRVAVRTDLPGCTGEMFKWWFDSAPDTERYNWWHPGDHVSSAWRNAGRGEVAGSTHVVAERLNGGDVHDLQINFIDPGEFYDSVRLRKAFDDGDASVAICAAIGFGEDPPHDAEGRPIGGRMSHLGRDTGLGLVLRSSFWLGYGIEGDPQQLREQVPDDLGLSLMVHSNSEWKHLARILPALYHAESDKKPNEVW